MRHVGALATDALSMTMRAEAIVWSATLAVGSVMLPFGGWSSDRRRDNGVIGAGRLGLALFALARFVGSASDRGRPIDVVVLEASSRAV